MKSSLYTEFHSKTKSHKKTILLNDFTYKLILQTLDKYIKTNQSILDIGCGAGTLALYCASKGNRVIGIDISSDAIKAATQSSKNLDLKNVKFIKNNFPKEYPKGSYDLIICTEVIEHLEEDKKAMKIIHKLLSPNGIVIVSTPSKNAPLYRLGLADSFDMRVGHLRRYSLDDLKKLSNECGFRVIKSHKQEGIIRNSLFILPYLGELIRLIKFQLVDVVTFIDNISLKLFGESQLFVVLKKK